MDMTNITAGFARLDITPFLGVPMAGSWQAREVQGVYDPLFVNAVAFGDSERSAVLIVCDLVGIYRDLGKNIAGTIAEALEIPKEAVICHCTHTHTGPSATADSVYSQFLQHRMLDAAKMAMADRKPVTDVRFGETETVDMTCVRRYKLKDGTVMTNPPKSIWGDIVDIAGKNDPSLRLVRILREDAPEIALVNFQAHPDNIGGEYISADFPGAMRNTVEQAKPDTKCVFLQGCEGQMVVGDRRKQPWIPASIQKATNHGIKLGQYILDMYDAAVSTQTAGLSYGRKSVRLKTKYDPARIPEAQRIIDLHNAGRDDLIHPVQKLANYIRAEASRLLTLDQTKMEYLDTEICGMAFCGVAFAGFPGEPFNEVGQQVRKNSKFPGTCTLALSNGAYGYFPTAEGHDEGGYESYNTPYTRGTAEQMADTADALLAEL